MLEKLYAKAKKACSGEWIYGYAMQRSDGTAMMYVPESNKTFEIVADSIRLYKYTVTDESGNKTIIFEDK